MPLLPSRKSKQKPENNDSATSQPANATSTAANASPSSNNNNNNTSDNSSTNKKRHLPDITKVQVTSRDPLSPKELKLDLQRLVQHALQTKVMAHTIDTIITTATSVSRQQDLFRLLSRGGGEERELLAVLGTEDKQPNPSYEPSPDHVRIWASTLVAFVATEAHSKLAASYLGVSKQHSVAASVAELEAELEWFFARYDPRHTHFAKTIASHFHNNVAMQTGLARFLFQDLLWVVLGISKEEDVHFPYSQTVEAALGLGTVQRLHDSYLSVAVWNKERNEQVRKQAQESAISEAATMKKATPTKDEKNPNKDGEEKKDGGDSSPNVDDQKQEQPSSSSSPASAPSVSGGTNQNDDNHTNNNAAASVSFLNLSMTASSSNNNINKKLIWSPQATAAIILVAEFALRQQKQVASAVYASIPPLYRDTFSWVAHPWLEIPLDFKQFPKPFILYDLWALDTIHRFIEFRQFCIDQLQSFFLEESGAFNVIEDARRSSEQVLRRKAGIQFIVVRRALEMLVRTEVEHRSTLEMKRKNFLEEAKLSMMYAGDYRAMRLQNMFNPVHPSFHGKFHAMKLVIEENAREIQRIGRAVGEKQRLQAEAAKKEEHMKQFAGKSHHSSQSFRGTTPTNGRRAGGGIGGSFDDSMTRAQKASEFLKSSNAMKRILNDEKQHRRHVLHTLSDMDDQERELTNRLKRHAHLVDVSELMPIMTTNDENNDDDVDNEDNYQDQSESDPQMMKTEKKKNQTRSQQQLHLPASSPLSPAQLLRSGYTERDAERHHESPSPAQSSKTVASTHNHQKQQQSLNPHLRDINASLKSISQNSPSRLHQPRNHYLHQKENEKKVVIDDDELQKVLYSHQYHMNNMDKYHHHHHQHLIATANKDNDAIMDECEEKLMREQQERRNGKKQQQQQQHSINNNNRKNGKSVSPSPQSRRRALSTSGISSISPHHSVGGNNATNMMSPSSSILGNSTGLANVSSILSTSSSSLSPALQHQQQTGGALSSAPVTTTTTTTQQRSLLEREKRIKSQQRAVTPTFWNAEAKSRVARVGTPLNNEMVRTGARGRRFDASQAVVNSSYMYRSRFLSTTSKHVDPKTMTNDELAAAVEGDGRLRLDTLKKTENFKLLRGKFYQLMYGKLFEAMGGDI